MRCHLSFLQPGRLLERGGSHVPAVEHSWILASPTLGALLTAFAAAGYGDLGPLGCYSYYLSSLIPRVSNFWTIRFGDTGVGPLAAGIPDGVDRRNVCIGALGCSHVQMTRYARTVTITV